VSRNQEPLATSEPPTAATANPKRSPGGEPESWLYVDPKNLRQLWLTADPIWNDVLAFNGATGQVMWCENQSGKIEDFRLTSVREEKAVRKASRGRGKQPTELDPSEVKNTSDASKSGLYYRLTPEVWAWIWKRAVALEDLAVNQEKEEWLDAYDEMIERIGPIMKWVDRQVRRRAQGWAGGVWQEIKNPKLPVAPFVPNWAKDEWPHGRSSRD
jgi:hypothetical protein